MSTLAFLSLTLFAATMRLLPHAPNFAPIGALAIFAGAYSKNKRAALFPLLAMLISDYILGFYDWRVMLSVYGSFAISAGIGALIRKKISVERVLFASISGSILFYIITNGAVWIWSDMYSHTLSGLIYCFTLALPFFRNTFLSDLFYTGTLFTLYESIKYLALTPFVLKYPAADLSTTGQKD